MPTRSSRRNNVKMKFMHGVVHGKAPDYLCHLISLTDDNDVAFSLNINCFEHHTVSVYDSSIDSTANEMLRSSCVFCLTLHQILF